VDPQPLSAVTELEREILRFIVGYVVEHEFPPTIREIAGHIERNTATTKYHLDRLQEKGRLVRAPNIPRGIRVIHLEAVDE
jgi:repressor LexA